MNMLINVRKKILLHSDLAWLTFNRIVNRLVKFSLAIYLAKVLGQTVYGGFAFAFRYMLIFSQIADLGLENTGIRLLSSFPKHELLTIKKITGLRTLIGVANWIVMLVIATQMKLSSNVYNAIIIFGLILVFGETYFYWPYYAFGKIRQIGNAYVVNTLVLIGSFLFVNKPEDFFIAVLFSTFSITLGTLYLVILFMVANYKKIVNRVQIDDPLKIPVPIAVKNIPKLLGESFPWALGMIMLGFYLGILPTLIKIQLGQVFVAYFDLAFQFPQFMIALTLMLYNSMFLPLVSPLATLDLKETERINIVKVLRVRLSIVLLGVLILFLTAPILLFALPALITKILGQDYEPAILPIIAFYTLSGISLLNLLIKSLLSAYGFNKLFLILNVLQIVVLVVTSLVLIARWKILGAAIAFGITELIILFLSLGVIWKENLPPIGKTITRK